LTDFSISTSDQPTSTGRAISTCGFSGWRSAIGRRLRRPAIGCTWAASRSSISCNATPAIRRRPDPGNLDHVAFSGVDLEATRAALEVAGVPFREAVVPRDRTPQIFVVDPDGITLELNFQPPPIG
jgi:catechol 2,3-dioxygenase-like lactoylglutathione lyase family enzyme